jgi:ABC-type branched-subunit amino acid transport system ATPase component
VCVTGKTTALNVLMGVFRPTSGDLFAFGEDIGQWGMQAALETDVGVCMQVRCV